MNVSLERGVKKKIFNLCNPRVLFKMLAKQGVGVVFATLMFSG